MKKLSLIGLILLLALCYSCKKDDDTELKVVEVNKVEMTTRTLSLVKGSTKQLEVKIIPEDASNKTIIWNSSNEEIVTISKTGLLTAIKEGEASIVVSTLNGKKDICEVKVEKDIIEVTEIKLTPKTLSIEEGASSQLGIEILPSNATDKIVNWISSNSKIVSVSKEGIVTAINEGQAIIKVTSSNNISSSCEVTVEKKIIHVSSITVNKQVSLFVGEEFDLDINILPNNATDKSIKWSISDEDIVFIDGDISIIGNKIGESIITLTTNDGGLIATCKVIVKEKIVGITCIDKSGKEYKTINIGEQIWMAENLAYIDDSELSTSQFVYEYTGNNASEAKANENYNNYGVLYTFESAEKSIPNGWHLPTDEEWKTLELYLGMTNEEVDSKGSRGNKSYKLMEKDLWIDVSFEITNETKFNARPAGYRNSRGNFGSITKRTVYWGAKDSAEDVTGRAIFNSNTKINRSKANKLSAYSVRCIKD